MISINSRIIIFTKKSREKIYPWKGRLFMGVILLPPIESPQKRIPTPAIPIAREPIASPRGLGAAVTGEAGGMWAAKKEALNMEPPPFDIELKRREARP
jgi:hypothetical protein